MKKVLLTIITFFFFLIPSNTFAQEIDYKIIGYHVDVTVNENNVLDIKETITADFNSPAHGIYRFIPLKNYVQRHDGTTSIVRAKIKNIEASEDFETYTENNNKVIKLGSANKTITGTNTYEIHYSYDLGKDKNKGFDEFYFNMIGDKWETTLYNVTIAVHMPKEYDHDKLGISTGTYGISGSNKVDVNFSGNNIDIKLLSPLFPREAVTARIELEDGYFTRNAFDKTDYVVIAVTIAVAFIGLWMWKKYGVDNQVVETVEFYAPDNLNSAEIGYIYKNYANQKDVTSLLIYLANQGYLRIEEKDKDQFTIIKLKDYDGQNETEEEFMSGLFKEKDAVTKDDLSEKFYKTVTSITFKLASLRSKIYTKKADRKRIPVGLLIVIAVALPLAYLFLKEETVLIMFSSICQIGTIIGTCFLANGIDKKDNLSKIIGIFVISVILFIFGVLIVQESIDINYTCIEAASLLSANILIICFIFIPKRTEYGTKIFGRIKGFKNFLENVEKEKLEQLVLDDPSYFYNILPFTYVLGISDKWIKKFESITMMPPEWYGGNASNVNVFYITNSIDRTFNSVSKSMISVPAPEAGSGWSGGDFGGGGFSGGGSGGGGGGAW